MPEIWSAICKHMFYYLLKTMNSPLLSLYLKNDALFYDRELMIDDKPTF